MRKKYTKTFILKCAQGKSESAITVSHIGTKNTNDPGGTITLADTEQDDNLNNDMELYQFAKITGVGIKMFFPEGTTTSQTPVQWSLAYSASEVVYPQLPAERMQTMSTYQTSSCTARTPVSRFFRTGAALRRLGIEWFQTDAYVDFGTAESSYGQQLPPDQGSSTHIKVFRPSDATQIAAELGRLQVTYYVMYKGTKGTNSLTAP